MGAEELYINREGGNGQLIHLICEEQELAEGVKRLREREN